MKSRTILVFAVAAASVYSQAESQTAVANSNLQLVDAPPHGPLNLLVGKHVTSVAKGDKLTIVEKKSYPGLSGSVLWYRVVPANNPKAAPLWVYAGAEGNNSAIQIEKNPPPEAKAVIQPPTAQAETKAAAPGKAPATQVAKRPAEKNAKRSKENGESK